MTRRIVSHRERFDPSWHTADVSVRPEARPPGGSAPTSGYGQQTPTPALQGTVGDWVNQDWRNGDGGAFGSSIRPPMSSDIPHPGKILKPNDKRLINTRASEDPEHDPWNVLGGSGLTFEDLVQNHLGHQQNLTPEQAYAGRVWYQAAHDATKDLAAKTTGHHGKAVATMSAYSPKTGWDENMEKGHHFLTHYMEITAVSVVT